MPQETLGPADHITCSLQSLAPSWTFLSMDAIGRSGGLAIGYNAQTITVDASWGSTGFMGFDIFSTQLGNNLRVVNFLDPVIRGNTSGNIY